MQILERCPVCDTAERTLACEYNRFILHEEIPAEDSRRYDFSLCHGCGLLYAVRRPSGEAYVSLLTNFNETLGRATDGNLALYPGPLTSEQREEIRRRAGPGVFVSEHTPLSNKDHIPMLLADRKAVASHLDLLSSLVDVRGRRVLEIRSRTGALLDQLRRLFEADPYAMPIFESQKAIIEDVYGIPTSDVIDFERFSIPFEGPFEVIVAKHMFTHALDPDRFFAALREKLVEGGHVYLYSEPDEAEAIAKRKSVFATMNPFHVQGFDRDTLIRCLRRMGFEPKFVTHEGGGFACLAQVNPAVEYEPISEPVLAKRVDAYARWREFSVLSLPKHARGLYSDEWSDIERDALNSGVAERDGLGRVKALSPRPGGKQKAVSPARAPAASRAVDVARATLRGRIPPRLRARLATRRTRVDATRNGPGDGLTELAVRHGTNKALATKKRRPLTEVYEPYLAARREDPIRVVEFGVEEGASLRMWRDYFPRAEIVGVDIVRNKAQYAGERIEVLIGDQKDPAIIEQIVRGGPLDLVVDDGSHRAEEQQQCLLRLWPHLAPDGLYIVEDIHTSYREKYDMRWRQPGTTVELLKEIVDDVHGQAHNEAVTLDDLEYIHFYFTTCVLKKCGGRASGGISAG